ncbi:MAG: valine--tRNA ligase [Phycisphaerales bacterium]|nr:valine--tRNA ligase [Phycisphaerales bacterium]
MSSELSKTYEPHEIEDKIYAAWIEGGVFDADPSESGSPYTIVIPPPNVTAPLHLGHALNNSLQDILIRFKRMQQNNTLWMPGTDHAGIATQTVVEKRILAQENRRRTDFPREEFVQRIVAWKEEYEAKIIAQLKAMGCSCDWRRTRFTMDDMCAKAVRENFFKLFSDELIYRGKRLVNWDPATQTVLADDEVEHESVNGSFWYMQYPLAESVEAGGETITHITVATTRPETMLGDTAVAMSPSDPRAAALVGKMVRLPLVGRLIPIIADDHVVLPDPESDDEKAKFSTGFLKVTPAHDPDDYQIGMRHDLPLINVMAPDGSISDRHGWDDAMGSDAEQFLGMDRFEARAAIVEWFRIEGLLEDVRDYTHEVGHSYRSHVPIEPYLSDQWYVAVKKPIAHLAAKFGEAMIADTDVPANSLAGIALKPLLDGRLRFTPERYAKTYQTWLENLRDWPISRQLWWGHQIPVWSQDLPLPEGVEGDLETKGAAAVDLAAGGSLENALGQFPVRYGVQYSEHPEDEGLVRTYICIDCDDQAAADCIEQAGWTRDPDVLDTWFSSALWPFSTLGWPEQTDELEKYYPGNVLCTAREIITLWVSRMVMMGQYCVGDIPFTDVFIHAMIQDGQGRKMSKSLGNGIDPLDIIKSHGADAMRFTLAQMTTQTQDVRMPVELIKLPDGRELNSSPKFDIGRNFCNKLWNASRFAMMNLKGAPAWSQIRPAADLSDTWILSRLNSTIASVTAAVEAFKYSEMAEAIYHFMWDDLCNWYLEIAKFRIGAGQDTPKAIVAHCLDVLLRLLHPICPFITEAIWAQLNELVPMRGPGGSTGEPVLARAAWPRADAAAINEPVEQQFEMLTDLIRQCRNIRTKHAVAPSDRINAIVDASGDESRTVSENIELIKAQAGLGEITVGDAETAQPSGSGAVTGGGVRIFLLDVIDASAEIARLTKQAETLQKGIAGIQGKLGNENFVSKAPAELVEKERQRMEGLQRDLQTVQEALEAVG